tara:strand:- start:419 stop:697 length:279 start_codon:yes stop_codon:yes gene_type:complete
MTDTEINKALALAIGWKEWDMVLDQEANRLCFNGPTFAGVFDYRDWNVIGPIAERYDCFPKKANFGGWVNNLCVYTTTPQRAIALAVIGVEK